MLGFILRFVQRHNDGARVVVPPDNHRDFLVLFGLIQRVRRLARAYLALRHRGFVSEGTILIRSALEHAVTAQWAYLTPGGVDRLHVSLARSQADVASAMIEYSSDPQWETRAASLREGIPPGPGLPKLTGPQGMVKELDDVLFLSMSYRVLSQVGHVSYLAPLDFIDTGGDEISLREQPEPLEEAETLYALAGFSMLSAWIEARLEDRTDEIRRLHEIACQLSIPWRLDTHLPAGRFLEDE